MREIKFRVWASSDEFPDGHMFLLGDHGFAVTQFGDVISCDDRGQHCWARIGFSGVLVMQYTGLKDKNGVEIYEGDYLRCQDSMTHRVSWWDGQAKFCLETWDGECFEHGLCDYLEDWIEVSSKQIKHAEVIGNIHEHPELLEQSK